MTLTRESLLWWALLALALIGAVAALSDAAAVALGVPVAALPYLRLVAFLTGVGATWAKTSPFPSKHDAPSVNLSKVEPL